MIKIEADTHSHTIASDHAYSTVIELANEAAKKGLKAIAITDHGPALSDGPHPWHFRAMNAIPRKISGVLVLRGAEANLLDYDGSVDLNEDRLEFLDWVIVSIHDDCFAKGTVQQHTNAWLAVVRNPLIDVIGHSGQDEFKYDYEQVIAEAKKYDKIIEINNHSFHKGVRPGSHANCIEIAKLCKKHGVKVVVNSDAHFATALGELDEALKILEEIDFPPELVLNSNANRLIDFINKKRNRDIEL